MKYRELIVGPTVGVADMARARDLRLQIQQQLLAQYQTTLISFSLNIMGAIKVFPLSVSTYGEGKLLISNQCAAYSLPVIHTQEVLADTGHECFFLVNAPVERVKLALCDLERDCALGRLFDIDVLAVDGRKLSRSDVGLPGRKCLLCGENAFVCSRSRAHSLDALLECACETMWTYFAQQYATTLSDVAVRALLGEVLATPKPGLVDQENTGAHRDMDIHTFERSALALMPYFANCTLHGIAHSQESGDQVLQGLRPLGIQAEVAMRKATGGVNTHKGAIFSMGIVLCALGVLYGQQQPYSQEGLQQTIKTITAPLERDFAHITPDTAMSHGERLYVQHGLRGARGEAIDGFPHLFALAYPRFAQLRSQGLSLNDGGIITLIDIIAQTEDSNLVFRSDYQTMQAIGAQLKQLCQIPLEQQDYRGRIAALDQQFIAQNLSPGGSADLLALTYFLYFLQREVHPED